jgi:hypothetical protein
MLTTSATHAEIWLLAGRPSNAARRISIARGVGILQTMSRTGRRLARVSRARASPTVGTAGGLALAVRVMVGLIGK